MGWTRPRLLRLSRLVLKPLEAGKTGNPIMNTASDIAICFSSLATLLEHRQYITWTIKTVVYCTHHKAFNGNNSLTRQLV
jgi:hypothetical protein